VNNSSVLTRIGKKELKFLTRISKEAKRSNTRQLNLILSVLERQEYIMDEIKKFG